LERSVVKIGILVDGDTTGTTYHQRYQDLIKEAVLADELGFSCWGTSEQHFSGPRLTVSAPDSLYGAVAAQTERITIRYMAVILLTFNHPIQVAERLAALDLVSNGRAELCTARGNYRPTMDAFGVSPDDTRGQWAESLEVIVKALTEDPFEHDGKLWQIPPRSLVPKPLQQPHPALYVVGSSTQSHQIAGEKGLGIMCFDNYYGWEYMQECIDAYKEAIKNPEPVGGFVNDYVGFYIATPYCAPTREQAKAEASEQMTGWLDFIMGMYKPLEGQVSYEYFSKISELEARKTDVDYLMDISPTVMVGTPDDLIERCHAMESCGVDELLIRVDGFDHERHMRLIETLGKYVIPEVDKSPGQPLAAARAAAV
jgi:alkanesulfonate monooxygenase SsuD/methylene tetrahydromethanopterin reductase-like flavin-dependent oxidoreductase (luciferase family)